MLLAIRFKPNILGLLSRPGRDFLLKALPPHGILVATNEEIRDMRTAITDTAPGEWQRWREVLGAIPKCARSLPCDRLADVAPVLNLPTLFVVPANLAARLQSEAGLPADGEPFLVLSGDLPCEVVPGDALVGSALLTERQSWSNGTLHGGSSREALWDRLSPILRHASHVVLCDRYLLEQAADLVANPGRSNGLSWLLAHMAAGDGIGGATVEVFSQIPDPPHDGHHEIEDMAAEIHSRLRPKADSVTVHAVDRRRFARLVHGRTIRLGGTMINRLVTVDNSISAFDQTHLTASVSFSYRNVFGQELATIKALEDQLRRLCLDDLGPVTRR